MEKGVFFFYPKVDNENKPKKQRRSRCVIAAIVNDENKTLSFGASICSTRDIFSKRAGRTKALGRAKYHIPLLVVKLDERPVTTLFVEKAKELEQTINSRIIGENKQINKTKKEAVIA